MSYHNGCIWPHDNALIAQGLARYGLGEMGLAIWTGMFAAGLHFDLHRMPELFCGFAQSAGEGPVPYPVACSPQAWSAAGYDVMTFQIVHLFWFAVATCLAVVAVIGVRLALQVYRQDEALLQVERLDGYFKTRRAGPDWLWRFVGRRSNVGF